MKYNENIFKNYHNMFSSDIKEVFLKNNDDIFIDFDFKLFYLNDDKLFLFLFFDNSNNSFFALKIKYFKNIQTAFRLYNLYELDKSVPFYKRIPIKENTIFHNECKILSEYTFKNVSNRLKLLLDI